VQDKIGIAKHLTMMDDQRTRIVAQQHTRPAAEPRRSVAAGNAAARRRESRHTGQACHETDTYLANWSLVQRTGLPWGTGLLEQSDKHRASKTVWES